MFVVISGGKQVLLLMLCDNADIGRVNRSE